MDQAQAQVETPVVYPRLVIEHNHGHLTLKNAREYLSGSYLYVEGEVVDGGETSRLFWATSYRAYEVGSMKSYPIYRKPTQDRSDPNTWRVNCQFCG